MNNNDVVVRLRYALDLKDEEMVEIFTLGDETITKESVQAMLIKTNVKTDNSDTFKENDYLLICTNQQLNAFLDGLIIFKRGKQDPAKKAPQTVHLTNENVNNVVLKKVKIALALTSDDILDLLDQAGISISTSELSAVLRKEGHRNYKPCGDRYLRNFLKGLAIAYRY
ncbi:hypothetical protein GCM10012290_01710 [Halolactibacillus alkaliphilus]|uniref:Cytoplasmic protein n=1 Tax=Halolactibacillus alkaliphilus TaxID=442899 RepID=A0A511X0L4_9BACI|nr:DUF1456 family protein [Halolactibacillus alkaliphilus]GEN56461.1 hypothetical protein HAL01_09250 [Halolactibacillus alkaliphilus]GGN64330.1 hypothetical protein GCM10012290_01710 [Halolactibacillus alkaliphilus]SFO61328.1 Uncharacterized conserved protein YehS, DUF1456 family [Halolactibacillus alkaliphilus]